MPGKNPASARPSRKRRMKKLIGPLQNANAPETKPQPTITRAIQRLAPTRSRIKLLGTSKRKYPKKNAPAPSPKI
jgi:hypothetical protein